MHTSACKICCPSLTLLGTKFTIVTDGTIGGKYGYTIFSSEELSRQTRQEYCTMIRSKTDCERAAKDQGLPDTDADIETVNDFPGGCYFYKADNPQSSYHKTLWFNENFKSEAKSCKPEAGVACLCKL